MSAAATALYVVVVANRAGGGKSLSSQKLSGLHLLPPCEIKFGLYSPPPDLKANTYINHTVRYVGVPLY